MRHFIPKNVNRDLKQTNLLSGRTLYRNSYVHGRSYNRRNPLVWMHKQSPRQEVERHKNPPHQGVKVHLKLCWKGKKKWASFQGIWNVWWKIIGYYRMQKRLGPVPDLIHDPHRFRICQDSLTISMLLNTIIQGLQCSWCVVITELKTQTTTNNHDSRTLRQIVDREMRTCFMREWVMIKKITL